MESSRKAAGNLLSAGVVPYDARRSLANLSAEPAISTTWSHIAEQPKPSGFQSVTTGCHGHRGRDRFSVDAIDGKLHETHAEGRSGLGITQEQVYSCGLIV